VLDRYKVEVEEAEVEKALERLARQPEAAERKADRAAAKGDLVIIDFGGKLDGEPFEGGAATDHKLELGSGRFVPGFEDQLVGAKAGDQRVVDVTFPEKYGNEKLAGRRAQFDVTIKDVRERVALPIDEALAKTLGFEDLASLRKAVTDQLGREFGELARLKTKRELLDKLAAAHDFPVPQGMIELELDGIARNLERERQAGLDDESTRGKSIEEVKTEFRPIAERRVRLGLVLSEVGRLNNIQVGQEEINRAIVEQARRYPGQERKVVEFYRNTPEALAQLRGPLFEEKVVDFIVELAKTSDKTVSVAELTKAAEA
jgi:trigger factor